MDKRAELLALAKLRQATRYQGYKRISDYHGGAYECDFVSPYTKTAGNIDAEIMVMLQDWSSDDSLSCHRPGDECKYEEDSATLGFSQRWPTTRNLIRLLEETFKLINHQRGRLEKKHPSLKTRRDVIYKLEWLVDGKWVADGSVYR